MNTGSYLKNYARPSIILRLADFYLYYAEVCNEVNPSDKNVIVYLDKVRERAGIAGYQDLHNKGIKSIRVDASKISRVEVISCGRCDI